MKFELEVVVTTKRDQFVYSRFSQKHVCGTETDLGPGARFSKDPVTTGPVNLPGLLTGNFTGPGIAFLEAPVNFPDTYRAR